MASGVAGRDGCQLGFVDGVRADFFVELPPRSPRLAPKRPRSESLRPSELLLPRADLNSNKAQFLAIVAFSFSQCLEAVPCGR